MAEQFRKFKPRLNRNVFYQDEPCFFICPDASVKGPLCCIQIRSRENWLVIFHNFIDCIHNVSPCRAACMVL